MGIRSMCFLWSVVHREEVKSRLLCSRSRVATAKKITVPRLELCGAALLVELIGFYMLLCVGISSMYLWTNSIIVLLWISLPYTRFNTLAANRVARIQETINLSNLKRVPTLDYRADLIARRVTPKVVNLQVWWQEPQWLRQPRHGLL